MFKKCKNFSNSRFLLRTHVYFLQLNKVNQKKNASIIYTDTIYVHRSFFKSIYVHLDNLNLDELLVTKNKIHIYKKMFLLISCLYVQKS